MHKSDKIGKFYSSIYLSTTIIRAITMAPFSRACPTPFRATRADPTSHMQTAPILLNKRLTSWTRFPTHAPGHLYDCGSFPIFCTYACVFCIIAQRASASMARRTNSYGAVDQSRRYKESAVAIGAIPWIGSIEFEN